MSDADSVGVSETETGAPAADPVGGRTVARRWAVVLNASAGSVADGAQERVRAALTNAGIDATVYVSAGRDAVALARRAAADRRFDTVVAAGGDGTVSAVAGVLAGTEKTLGVLPLGTLNHFAKDLGIPTDLEGAARALAGATPRPVDVGEVNGRVFVNNSSVGVYPRVVRARERLRAVLGAWIGKWAAMAWATTHVLLRLTPLSLRMQWEGADVIRRTTFVFVGNNRYDTAVLTTQRRAFLDRGILGVYVGNERTRLALLRLAIRGLLGRIDASDVEALEVRSLTLMSRRRTALVALDGEVVRLGTPIRYRLRAGALRVLAPTAGVPA